MLDLLFECVVQAMAWLVAEFAVAPFVRKTKSVLPRNILYGTSWRERARSEIMARRSEMKGMA